MAWPGAAGRLLLIHCAKCLSGHPHKLTHDKHTIHPPVLFYCVWYDMYAYIGMYMHTHTHTYVHTHMYINIYTGVS